MLIILTLSGNETNKCKPEGWKDSDNGFYS